MKTKSPPISDERIIEMYFDRNEDAIAATDKKYRPYLYTIAYNILKDGFDCEECLDDTYLSTWNAIPPKRPSIFHAFLARITRNTATDRFRKNTAEKRIPSELLVSLEELDECLPCSATPEDEISVREICRALNDYLNSLSERDEFIFVCRYYYADKLSDIAGMLKIGTSTVHDILRRMRVELKALLVKEGLYV